jgi:hypothetical protein
MSHLASINRIKAAWSRCCGNFVNRKGKQPYSEHVEQYAKDGATAWVSCDDASARCKDGGPHEPCLQRVINPLSDPDKHQSQAEQKRLNVGDPLYIKGQGRKRTCCSKCHKEVVPVLHLKPGLRFISHTVNDNQAKSGGAA